MGPDEDSSSVLVSAWREISDATTAGLTLDNEVDSILEKVRSIGFSFATVSLVDDYRRVIETIRGWNVPNGWIRRSRHGLGTDDIQADVVTKKATQRITGPDKRLDSIICERFHHERLSRVWVPIFDGNAVVGTIETGCPITDEAQYLTEANIATIEQLGRDRGPLIARARPFVLLKVIADKACEVMGANLASVHVFQCEGQAPAPGELPLLMAGAGIEPRELLEAFFPDQNVLKINGPITFPWSGRGKDGDKLCGGDVRWVTAFPLTLGDEAKGVLSLYFFDDRPVEAELLELGSVFARQAEVAIRSSLLMKSVAATAGLAWNISGFQNVIQAVASSQKLDQVLQEVARNVLYMLDADCVTIYQFLERENRFVGTPVAEGVFVQRDKIHNPRNPEGTRWKLVQQQKSELFPDVARYPILSSSRSSVTPIVSTFVEREKIESYVPIVLRAGARRDEAVGLMFVNYRSPTKFTAGDERVFSALASSAAIAIHAARLHEEVEQSLVGRLKRQIRSFQALTHVVERGSPVESDLKTTLRMLLAGVTAAYGVGFSRAMLFLVEDDRLVGEMAVGSATRTEADRVWKRLDEQPEMDFATVLDEAAKLSEDIRMGGSDCPLSLAVQLISVPIGSGSGALVRCALDRQPVPIELGEADPFREQLRQAVLSELRRRGTELEPLDQDPELAVPFVCVPLNGRGENSGRTFGVLVCDNRFLYGEAEIDLERIPDIVTFAAVASMRIENDRLRRERAGLQEWENWRKGVDQTRHRLRATVDDIFDRAMRVSNRLTLGPAGNWNVSCSEMAWLVNEIGGVKQTLAQLGQFSRPPLPDLGPLDLITLIGDAIHIPDECGCVLKPQFPAQRIWVTADKKMLSYTFTELTQNALHAMRGDNEGRPKEIGIVVSFDKNSKGGSFVVVEFYDTGRGIQLAPDSQSTPDEKDWVFKPFLTTKPDIGGNGLGLAIVRQDMRAQNGSIRIKETGMRGTCFELRIPDAPDVNSQNRPESDL